MLLFGVGCKDKAPTAATPETPTAPGSCTQDSDCVISCETRGGCCHAPCCETVISSAELADTQRYNASHCTDEDRKHCPTVGGCVIPDYLVVPRCQEHRCVGEKVPKAGSAAAGSATAGSADTGSAAFALACKTAADCTVVNMDPCDKCGCERTPVAISDEAKAKAAAAAIKCSGAKDPRVCGECMPAKADCVGGRCVAK